MILLNISEFAAKLTFGCVGHFRLEDTMEQNSQQNVQRLGNDFFFFAPSFMNGGKKVSSSVNCEGCNSCEGASCSDNVIANHALGIYSNSCNACRGCGSGPW